MSEKKKVSRYEFCGTKVLVMGLGLHGGGEATVRWLVGQGAKVTVTDMRDKGTLTSSLRALRGLPLRFVLGKHRASDFRSHDIIVVNPGVPRESKYLRLAKSEGKRIENVASLFFGSLKNPAISVTGTRGKTTTTLWVAELLRKKYPLVRQSGTPENALLDELERVVGKNAPVVAELSSWQLEYLPAAFAKRAGLPESGKAPDIVAITNIYPEHLNRYRNINDYADAKANIFLYQRKGDALVLNHDDPWHKYFLKKKPKSALYYISKKTLPQKLNGAYVKNGKIVLRNKGRTSALFSVVRFRRERGEHNLENLLRAALIAKLFDPTVMITERDVLQLPTPHMRQETIYTKGQLVVVNDSCATSPDGTIAAIRRFATLHQGRTLGIKKGSTLKGQKPKVILIAGGTDKKLQFGGLASEIKKYVPMERLVLFEGSATKKLTKELASVHYGTPPQEYSTLKACVAKALAIAGGMKEKTVILFSPGAASFEKFLHEFDRGEKFNRLVKKYTK